MADADALGAHPAQHLADAITSERESRLVVGSDLSSLSRKGASLSQAAGHALAFLLHPHASSLEMLRPRALRLLSLSALALGDFRSLLPHNGDGGSGSQGRKQQAAWEIRAGKTLSFKKLLGLTGLSPVKQALAELADKVGTHRFKDCVLYQPKELSLTLNPEPNISNRLSWTRSVASSWLTNNTMLAFTEIQASYRCGGRFLPPEVSSLPPNNQGPERPLLLAFTPRS